MRLTVRGNDLFEGGNPVTRVDEQGQKSRMKLWQDSRNVTLTLRYSFGGYKEKKGKRGRHFTFGDGDLICLLSKYRDESTDGGNVGRYSK